MERSLAIRIQNVYYKDLVDRIGPVSYLHFESVFYTFTFSKKYGKMGKYGSAVGC